MAKRERLEDLGVIKVKLENLLEDIDLQFDNLLGSKHCFEDFMKKYNGEEGLDDIHRFLRLCLMDKLHDILSIAIGDEE